MSYGSKVLAKYSTAGGQVLGICQKNADAKFYVFLDVEKSGFQISEVFPPEKQISHAIRYLESLNPLSTFEEAEDRLKNGFIGLHKIPVDDGWKIIVYNGTKMKV
ncbi:MAG: hypothetical protein V1648_04835 [Candidatus Aenigmatarchaeota archaeon]